MINYSLYWSIFRAAVFLLVGTLIGFCLGLAYASHLFGQGPVATQIQAWLAGDNLYQAPLPVDMGSDIQGRMRSGPVSIIPKIGALIGFGISASVLVSSLLIRATGSALKSSKAMEKSAGQAAKDSGGQAAKDSGGQAAKDSGGQAAKDSGGQAAKDSGGQAAKDSGGEAAKDSGGQTAKDSGGETAEDSGTVTDKDSGGQSGSKYF